VEMIIEYFADHHF